MYAYLCLCPRRGIVFRMSLPACLQVVPLPKASCLIRHGRLHLCASIPIAVPLFVLVPLCLPTYGVHASFLCLGLHGFLPICASVRTAVPLLAPVPACLSWLETLPPLHWPS
jgi:hypothetical protein